MNQTMAGGFKTSNVKNNDSVNSIAKRYMEQLERAQTKRTESTDTKISEPARREIFDSVPTTM